MLTAIVNALQFPVVVQFAPKQLPLSFLARQCRASECQFFSDFQINTTTQTRDCRFQICRPPQLAIINLKFAI
jgi:hypothetical protein